MALNKRWYELLGRHIKADMDERGNDSFAVLSKRGKDKYSRDLPLSPVTNFLLNVWSYSIENNKNLILNFPGNMVKTIPLLAFMYSKVKSKSTLVFTSGNSNLKTHISGMHNRAYYLLSWEMGGYVYNEVPMGVITKNELKSNPHMIHATNTYKKQNKERLKKELISSDKPKILLNGTDNATRITNTIENIFIEDKKVNSSDLNLNLDIGCLIFENADRYISSNLKAEQFSNWLKNTVSEDVLILLHFSNSNLKFISDIKESTNSFVLPFNQNILRNNIALYDPSLNYFKKVGSGLKILNNYNLDNENNFNFNFNISIVDPVLEKGNLDLFLYYSQNILDIINPETIKNKNFFYRAINLLYSLNNLAINPSFYKFKVQIAPNSWRYINTPQFISLFSSRLDRENDVNQYLLNKLISNLNNFYQELFKCKRFGENNSYTRIGKDYQILDIAFNKENYFKHNNKLLIGVYQNTESKILNKYFEDFDDIEVVYLRNLFINTEDMSDYNLLLPGIVPPKFFSILKRPFNQILILSHEGSNKNFIQNQIDLVLNPSIEDENVAMGYFEEIYDFMGESKNNELFNDFNKRYSELSVENEESEEVEDEKTVSIKELFEFNNDYKKYVEGRKLSEYKLEDSIYSENSSSNREYDNTTVSVNLRNLDNDIISTKYLSNNRKFLRFKSYDKLNEAMEVRPSLLNKNDYVIILKSNKSFLDLYLDIFGEDDYVDRQFIDYWKDLLYEYKENNDLNYNEFYYSYIEYYKNNFIQDFLGPDDFEVVVKKTMEKYSCSSDKAKLMIINKLPKIGFIPVGYQTFRNWVNGYTISPSSELDLLSIGNFLDDQYIIDNYKEMSSEAERLRNLNRSMGRKLTHIIKSIVQNSGIIDYNRLSMEERYIYDMIKDSIYQVV